MPAPFRIYNSLTRELQPFTPLTEGHIGLYVCGMTVYDHAHVGHARAMMVFDTFVRYLRTRGWDVTFVRNFTDVDDKIIRRAAERGVEPMALAESFIDDFHADADALGLVRPDHEPRVSTSIQDIQDLIQSLVDRGHAYEQDGSVWFSVPSDPNYGVLSGQDPTQLRSADTGTKRDPADFALWKGAKPGEPSWESPWGPGRPGWHIECSAMARQVLGPTIDIHGGGLDLIFPHHENEIAQSTCGNCEPYAKYWMHNGLLTMTARDADGKLVPAAKMGKSLGNAYNIREALAEFPAEALRLYYMQAHYRSALPWNSEVLPESLGMLARLYEAREVGEAMGGSEKASQVAKDLGPDAQTVLSLADTFSERFHGALAEDFNTSRAIGLAFELARAINRFANHKKARKRGAPVVAPALKALQELQALGLFNHSTEDFQEEVKTKRLRAMGVTEAAVEDLLVQRTQARADKNWGRADELRDQLDEMGIVVMDGAEGARWRVRVV